MRESERENWLGEGRSPFIDRGLPLGLQCTCSTSTVLDAPICSFYFRVRSSSS